MIIFLSWERADPPPVLLEPVGGGEDGAGPDGEYRGTQPGQVGVATPASLVLRDPDSDTNLVPDSMPSGCSVSSSVAPTVREETKGLCSPCQLPSKPIQTVVSSRF